MNVRSYSPPLSDMEFCLKEIGGLRDLLKFDPFSGFSEDLIFAIMEEAAKFSTSTLAPLNRQGDREGCQLDHGSVKMPEGFREAYRIFVENGWNGITVSAEQGGQGLPYVLATSIAEMWHSSNMAFSLCPLLTQGAIELVSEHASLELQQRFLPMLVSGDWTGTMCMTEPQAGSDVGMIRTTATPSGDHYLIKGTKIFISYGDHDMAENIVHMVLARLPDAPEGTKGLSLFLVPKFLVNNNGEPGERNDVTCVSIEHKMGLHASPTAVLQFGDKGGAIGYLVGAAHGGIEAMFTMMNYARLAVGLQGIAQASYACQLAENYAKERLQGRNADGTQATIDQHPGIRRELLKMQAHVSSLRMLAIYTARHMDIAKHHPNKQLRAVAQNRVDLLIPVVKAYSTDTAFDIISASLQLHGGMGYIEETGISQLLRDSRVTSIYEGTNEIQALDLVMRKVYMHEGDALKQLISEINEANTSFEKLEHPSLLAISRAVGDSVKQLDVATLWLMQQYQDFDSKTKKQKSAVQYIAPAYLKLVGLTIQGFLMAAACYKALKSKEYPPQLAEDKLAMAHFFVRELLPETRNLCQYVLRGDSALRVYDEPATQSQSLRAG